MNPYSNWYHTAITPTGVHVFHLDPLVWEQEARRRAGEDPELTYEQAVTEVAEDICEAQRRMLNFPIRGRWLQRPGWESLFGSTQPHPSVMATATVHTETLL
jgi:hypothetical protein